MLLPEGSVGRQCIVRWWMHISFSHLFHFGSFSSPSPSAYCQQAPDTALDETSSRARARVKKRRIKLPAKFDRFLGTMSIENVAASPVNPLFNHPLSFIALHEPRLDSTVMCPGRKPELEQLEGWSFVLPPLLVSVWLDIGISWRPLVPPLDATQLYLLVESFFFTWFATHLPDDLTWFMLDEAPANHFGESICV